MIRPLLAGFDRPLTVNATLAEDTSSVSASNSTTSRDEQLRKLTKEVDDAEQAYLHGSDKTERDKNWKKYGGLNATNVPAVMQLATRGPLSSTAIDSLVWVVTNGQVQAGAVHLRPYGL